MKDFLSAKHSKAFIILVNGRMVMLGSNLLFVGLDAVTLDVVGSLRAYNFAGGGVIDMGAYENQGHNTLPVSLISYTAKAEAAEARLNWRTGGEQDNQFFTLSRSTDGIGYKVIGKVTGKGDSGAEANYAFLDPLPMGGVNYYRLQQTDMEGRETLLGI